MTNPNSATEEILAIEGLEVAKGVDTDLLLSVTILNYNYGHYLPKCLDSILNQTMTNFEIILINDCSTDNSLEIIQDYLKDKRIRLVNHQKNQGYVASLLEGCDVSNGQYITVVSADDWSLDNQAFEKALTIMESDPEIVMCYSAWHEMDDSNNIRHTRRSRDTSYISDGVEEFRRLILSSPVLHSGTMIRRDAYKAVGGYDKNCRYSVDTNMWLKLCTAGKIAYINEPLYAYRSHNSNMSNTSDALWKATAEMLFGIDNALSNFPDSVLPDKARLRRQGYQRALVAVPTLDIFASRLRRGWYGWFKAFRHYPWLTLIQFRTIALVLRSVLGRKFYDKLRSFSLHKSE